MLGLAKRIKARILQTSTSEVYGNPSIHPQPETYTGNVNILGPRACYDEGKRAAETLFFDYHRQHGLEIRIARIFNTFGPNMARDDGRVVSNFITQALNNDDITIYGDGTQTRSFCYIDDMVVGLIKLMSHPNFTGPVNLGNPDEISIKQLAQEVIDLTGSKSNIIFQSHPLDDPIQRQPDITLAKEKLNWKPSINREEGLKKTISYFKKLLGQ